MKPVQTKWLLKACPRCHGDLLVDDGEITCLACGYTKDIKEKESDERVSRTAKSYLYIYD